ncbi:MAG: hypothetical protein HOD97_03355 [Candidatus Marinimicrobia bacterium]|jgi:hypothetical protein|nr:hypothetical protein [Candidatus Neomarinimicrobiota bacterium]MBT3618312.1 hypothetical protein [Candidatus Neomarinimicrobiota bacterium]MBT3828257.1 hypothetical protein [Candidatus Neomarinimicrobiota bacterium]MBT3997174.1 hypothetical protein [Candidatus Neomarinimicrobiota bacterium]MBT4280640.1 hypothetical protein [Candidatus Neomarinimicrobiota bacterium]
MDILKLSIFERLRDFRVPMAVLDEIFANSDDLAILIKSWRELESAGMTGDQIASQVADTIFKELDIDPHDFDEK